MSDDSDIGLVQGPDAMPSRCDVAVIGASLAGVASALFLARAGVDTVLIEAKPEIGLGASGLDLGLVELGVVEHPHRTMRALGDRAQTLLAWTDAGKRLLADEALLCSSGLHWLAHDERELPELEASAAALQAIGRRAEFVDAARLPAGTTGFVGGLWLPDEGLIAPQPALRALLASFVQAGGRVVGDTRVERIEEDDLLRVHTATSSIEAEIAILAAGTGTAALDPAMSGVLTSVREQLLQTAPTARAVPSPCRAGQGWVRFRQDADGRVTLGGARWASPHMAIGETAPVPEPRIQAKLDAFLGKHLAADLPVERRWAHCFASTPDGLPFVGRLPGESRKLVLAGFGASPLALSMAAARTCTDGLVTGQAEVPSMFSPRRLVRWRKE